jgi:hypothetical protein
MPLAILLGHKLLEDVSRYKTEDLLKAWRALQEHAVRPLYTEDCMALRSGCDKLRKVGHWRFCSVTSSLKTSADIKQKIS